MEDDPGSRGGGRKHSKYEESKTEMEDVEPVEVSRKPGELERLTEAARRWRLSQEQSRPGKDIQAKRYLNLRIGKRMQDIGTEDAAYCTLRVNAEELLKPYVCLSSFGLDTAIYETDMQVIERDEDTGQQWVFEDNEKSIVVGYTGKKIIGTPKYVFLVNEYILASIRKGECYNCAQVAGTITRSKNPKRYCMLKVDTLAHVAALLIDNREQVVEFFDSSGYSSKQARRVRELIAILYPKYRVAIPVFSNLQERDRNCQTWIYYYVYERVVKGRTPDDILEELFTLTAEERFLVIDEFRTNLLYQRIPGKSK